MSPRLDPPLLLCLMLAACAAPGGALDEERALETHDLAPSWREAEPIVFERDVLGPLAAAAPARLRPEDRGDLGAGLAEGPGIAVRAAVLLGRSGDPDAVGVLLARLEQRLPAPAREDDAGDCVAAAALALEPAGARTHGAGARLVALTAGERPHPDLEVRVECAAAALALGRDEPIPFLLKVLRIETRAGLEDQRDFAVSPTTAWARGRAAEALSARAGIPCTWSPDAPMAERERGAVRLGARLGEDLTDS